MTLTIDINLFSLFFKLRQLIIYIILMIGKINQIECLYNSDHNDHINIAYYNNMIVQQQETIRTYFVDFGIPLGVGDFLSGDVQG